MVVDHQDDDRTQSHRTLAKGTMVSHHRIIEIIGVGGMGELYLAEDTKLNRQVVLKFLPLDHVSDNDVKTRFAREAQAAAKLNHPNIVTIFEVSEYQGRPFFTMEYIDGQSLHEFAHNKPQATDKLIGWAIQICEGLDMAHQMGVIHRDIKPSNILVDTLGRLRILDFGLAKVKGSKKLTEPGMRLGTVAYLSPEQVLGKEVDQRSDLFSLGVSLYELITGTTPFKRDTEAATLSAIVEDTPEPLTRYRANVPDRLQQIVSKLLEKNASLRYQNAAGVISDLKQIPISGDLKSAEPSLNRLLNKFLVAVMAVLFAVIGIGVVFKFFVPEGEIFEGRKMLAVLPFTNLGSGDQEYFADGISEEITVRLAAFQGLGVISRATTMQYKKTDKSLQDIGKELGVDYILEGTICWDRSGDTNRVRVTPGLIDVSDDTQLWGHSYERGLTRIFAVQADIATRVAQALGITLLDREREALGTEPTNNLEAYTYYLRGIEYMSKSYDRRSFLIAVEMLQKGVELDPRFALAYAKLSSAHTWLYWLYENTDERLGKAKNAVDHALQLNPDLPEAHLALAQYYYQGRRDYTRALNEVKVVSNTLPNNTEVFLWTAGVQRRQGQWEKTVDNLKRVTELNPRNSKYLWELGRTYTAMREYQRAEECYNRAITVSPDFALAYGDRAFLHLLCSADAVKARQVLLDAAQKIKPTELAYELADCDIFDGDYASALRRFPTEIVPALRHKANYYLTKGAIYRLMNDTVMSVACFDSVRVMLEPGIDKEINSVKHARLGLAYAGLGRKDEAIREGKRAVELLPLSADAYEGTIRLGYLAMVYTMVDQDDLAIDQLELLLSVPSFFSAPYLRQSPIFAPLRDHPRFQALLEKYE